MRLVAPYSFLLSTLLAALLWCTSGGARAQSLDDDRARAHFVAGESHFAAQRWGDAEREFALAYELSRRPEMLINLSRAQERNEQLAEAIASLELLIAKHPENAYRPEAEVRVADMRRRLAERPPEPTVAPAQEPTPVVVAPEQAAPLPAVEVESEPERRHIWPPSILTMSLGGAALATAAVALGTGLAAHGTYNDLDERCMNGRCSTPFADKRDHGQALARTSTALTFVSLALAGGAAVLWVYDVKKRDQSTVSLGLDGAGARMRARF